MTGAGRQGRRQDFLGSDCDQGNAPRCSQTLGKGHADSQAGEGTRPGRHRHGGEFRPVLRQHAFNHWGQPGTVMFFAAPAVFGDHFMTVMQGDIDALGRAVDGKQHARAHNVWT